MSEKYVPRECPLCDSVGTIVLERAIGRVNGYGGRTVTYEHHLCYCTSCGERYETATMMDGNLLRAREAIKNPVYKCGTCQHFIGGGDWGLCCTKDYYLHYEYSDSCDKYEPKDGGSNV